METYTAKRNKPKSSSIFMSIGPDPLLSRRQIAHLRLLGSLKRGAKITSVGQAPLQPKYREQRKERPSYEKEQSESAGKSKVRKSPVSNIIGEDI